MCIGSDSKGSYTHSDRYKALRLVTGDQRTKDLIHTLTTKLPNHPTERTAYRVISQLRDGGYIRKEGKTWILTEAGMHHTSTKMNYLMVLPKIARKEGD